MTDCYVYCGKCPAGVCDKRSWDKEEKPMRYIICKEGVDVIANRFIVPGSLWCEDDQITISANFDFDSPPIGLAKDIRRDDNFVWTAEIGLFGVEVPPESGFSIYISPVEYHMWKDVAWCTKGLIRGIALVPYQFWPQQREEDHGAKKEA